MSKKKLARAIAVCILAMTIIVVATLLPGCESGPTMPTYGLDFDGVDDCVALGNATALGFTSQDFTIEAWIKSRNMSRLQQILQRASFNTDGYRFYIYPGGSLKFVTFQSGANQQTISNSVLTASNWTHVAAVRQGASATIYVNGIDETKTAGSHIDPAYSPTRMAAIGTAYVPEAFDGCVSEVRVWNYARTESQIKADISKKLIGTEEGLVGYWKLDEGSGTIAHDSTANNNSGTLVGGPVWLTGGG